MSPSAIQQISASQPKVRILALTSFATDDKVFPAIKAGALGYLLKDAEPEELVTAIHQVYRGEPSLPPNIARKLLREIRQPPPHTQVIADPLTTRELEVLALVARGLDNQAIAKLESGLWESGFFEHVELVKSTEMGDENSALREYLVRCEL